MIRRATPKDIGFLLEVAREVYPAFDLDHAAVWAAGALQSPKAIWVRGEYGFAVVALQERFYESGVVWAELLFLAARPNPVREGVRLFEAVIRLAFEAGATEISFTAETAARFGALAKRYGATRESPVYSLRRGDWGAKEKVGSG